MNLIRSFLAKLSHGTVASIIAGLTWLAATAAGGEAWLYAAIAAAVAIAHRASAWLDRAQAAIAAAKTGFDKFLHSLSGALALIVPALAPAVGEVESIANSIFAAVAALITWAHHITDAVGRATFPNTPLTRANTDA